MRNIACAALIGLLVVMCGGDDDDPPPPPEVAAQPVAPQQTMVTVVANSSPPGAQVMGGGRDLGVTPLQTQVPVPPAAPGQVQSFAFTFNLAGYQPATINAAPVNNTITITAALAPVVAAEPVAAVGDTGGGADGAITVAGRGGGPIFDNHTTTGTANVTQSCVIERLRVRLRGRHSYYGDLHITLRSPSGRSFSLASGGRRNPFRAHTVRRASGQQAQGRWRLAIADRLDADTGVLSGWSLSFTCQ